MRWVVWVNVIFGGVLTSAAMAQSSSLMSSPSRVRGNSRGSISVQQSDRGRWAFSTVQPADTVRPMTRSVEQASLIAVPVVEPRKFKTNDLITIIVRQQKRYEADAEYDSEKKWEIDGGLREWFRFYPNHHLGTDNLSNGNPTFKFDFKNRYETEGESERRDKFETRVTARIIDVKPNGNLVLEASSVERHDEEKSEITLTGTCRSEDVTPENTILSTQIAEVVLTERNKGAVRDATMRGWVPRILDFLKPF